jgi:predicted DNA binding CopG/RHH family protein
LRLPVSLLEQIKIAANKRNVPYQSLIKMWLAEKVG